MDEQTISALHSIRLQAKNLDKGEGTIGNLRANSLRDAADILESRIAELEAQLAEIRLQYNGIEERAKYTKNPVITTGLACAITGKTLFELENEE